ncbi:MAG: DUF4214 domain-containing protein [Acidimicrobiales bacterium]
MYRRHSFILILALLISFIALVPAASAAPSATSPTPVAAAEQSSSEFRVKQLYAAFLRRTPTESELSAGVATLEAEGWVAVMDELSLSEEWLGRFVDNTYQRTLDRDPDVEGRAYWVTQLQSGLTTAEILDPILNSEEFQSTNAANDAAVVGQLFQQILARPVDTAGADYWESIASELGADQVAANLFASSEFQQLLVDELYELLLCRDSDAEGRLYWADLVGVGGELELARLLVASTEFHAATETCGDSSVAESDVITPPDGAVMGVSDDASLVVIQASDFSYKVLTMSDGSIRALAGEGKAVSRSLTRAVTEDGSDLILHDLTDGTSAVITPGWSSLFGAQYVVADNGIVYRHSNATTQIERFDPGTTTVDSIFTSSSMNTHYVSSVSADGSQALLFLADETNKLQWYKDGTLTPITSTPVTYSFSSFLLDGFIVEGKIAIDGGKAGLVATSQSNSDAKVTKVNLVDDTTTPLFDYDNSSTGYKFNADINSLSRQALNQSAGPRNTLTVVDLNGDPKSDHLDVASEGSWNASDRGNAGVAVTYTVPGPVITIQGFALS